MIRRAGGSRVTDLPVSTLDQEPLPLPVVPDWDDQVRQASRLTCLIDRHLDHEERTRLVLSDRMTPIDLCPEQRVSMLTDLLATIRRR
jgi:hypothetical protein